MDVFKKVFKKNPGALIEKLNNLVDSVLDSQIFGFYNVACDLGASGHHLLKGFHQGKDGYILEFRICFALIRNKFLCFRTGENVPPEHIPGTDFKSSILETLVFE